jgi:O-antigen/teichoic acid export membrane protein
MAEASRRAVAGDLAWNYASVAVLAVSGLAFNFIVAGAAGAAALGVFNLAYSVYLLASQLASAGIHMSVLRRAAQADAAGARRQLATALAASLGTSLAVAAALYGALALAGALGAGGDRLSALLALPPALPFFALNKVALNYLNARGRMRAYAALQALRFVLIGAALATLAALAVTGPELVYCFALAEAALAIGTAVWLAARGDLTAPNNTNNTNSTNSTNSTSKPTGTPKAPKTQPQQQPQQQPQPWPSLIRAHLWFGVRIMPANLVLEFNTKIDLVVLSLLTGNDTLVGYYSFASLFVEGFYQVFVVVRRQVNPSLARFERQGAFDAAAFAALRAKLIRWLLPAGLAGAAALIGVYQIVPWALGAPGYRAATWPLALMLAAVAATAIPVTLGNIMNQTGHPAAESAVNLAAAGSNLIASLALVPILGMWGAAIGVGISYIVFGVALRRVAARRLHIRL